MTHNLWRLRHLNLEDLHLITDTIFFFDHASDGRVAAQQQMLCDLRELHVGECGRLTDRAFGGLSTRATQLERLHCRGVAGLSDEGLGYLHVEPTLQHARGDKLKAVDLSRCTALSDRAVDALARACPILEEVDLSFCLRLTDRATRSLCDHCPAVKHLGLGRCRRLTDATACLVADALWLEALDLSQNPRLSDAAVEVLASELGGLTRLDVSGCALLSDASLAALRFHALALRRLVAVDCPGLSPAALDELRAAHPDLDVRSSVEHVEDGDRPQWVPADADPDHSLRRARPPPVPASEEVSLAGAEEA